MQQVFNEGKPQSISDVLENKDHRNYLQTKLMTQFPNDTIITVKLNIPGPIKNNQKIKKLFDLGTKDLLKQFKIVTKQTLNSDAGPELLFVTKLAAKTAKEIAIKFEDKYQYRRLFDIDVLNRTQGHYSRQDLGYSLRKCLICNDNAKDCARSRKHSVADLQAKITEIYNKEFSNE